MNKKKRTPVTPAETPTAPPQDARRRDADRNKDSTTQVHVWWTRENPEWRLGSVDTNTLTSAEKRRKGCF